VKEHAPPVRPDRSRLAVASISYGALFAIWIILAEALAIAQTGPELGGFYSVLYTSFAVLALTPILVAVLLRKLGVPNPFAVGCVGTLAAIGMCVVGFALEWLPALLGVPDRLSARAAAVHRISFPRSSEAAATTAPRTTATGLGHERHYHTHVSM